LIFIVQSLFGLAPCECSCFIIVGIPQETYHIHLITLSLSLTPSNLIVAIVIQLFYLLSHAHLMFRVPCLMELQLTKT